MGKFSFTTKVYVISITQLSLFLYYKYRLLSVSNSSACLRQAIVCLFVYIKPSTWRIFVFLNYCVQHKDLCTAQWIHHILLPCGVYRQTDRQTDNREADHFVSFRIKLEAKNILFYFVNSQYSKTAVIVSVWQLSELTDCVCVTAVWTYRLCLCDSCLN